MNKRTARSFDESFVLTLGYSILLSRERSEQSSCDPLSSQEFVEFLIEEFTAIVGLNVLHPLRSLILYERFEVLEYVKGLALVVHETQFCPSRVVISKCDKIPCLTSGLYLHRSADIRVDYLQWHPASMGLSEKR